MDREILTVTENSNTKARKGGRKQERKEKRKKHGTTKVKY